MMVSSYILLVDFKLAMLQHCRGSIAKSTPVQGSVSANRLLRFRQRFSELCVHLIDSDKVIPTELFRFRPYDELRALANTNKQLPDIIGELNAIRSTINDRLPGAKCIMLTLRLDSAVNVCVSMFDSLAIAFHDKFESYGSGSRPASVFIQDETCPRDSSFTCVSCNESNAEAALRYRVTLSVSDDTDTTSFLAFDMEMAKLTNIQASEAAQIVVDTELPRSLAEIEGANAPEAALHEVVVPGTDEKDANTCNVAEEPSTSDASTAGGPASAKKQVAADRNARKKARVE
ncbi:unnamed protein product [Brassica oleracea var. botrytis]|uniref:Replication factor A C-terminal domain-containing protein n=3 Tax=Brassica TaxID=3705 RepID=A0A0D3E9Q4_BRAOL|nr:hypothetical protein HID58_087255 [Brassica napus]CAF1750352.1 unnamed protein product [Brassica napus]VDD31438.1 unnamed protein product [Brassica oleracea]